MMRYGARGTFGLVPAGLAMIAVTYGLARFAYGLFLPELREAFGLNAAVLGLIGSGSYVGYCAAITISLVYTSKVGPRFMAVAAGLTAVVGMALVAAAPNAPFLAAGVLIAGSSTGLASPPMAEAVSKVFDGSRQDRANTLINSGTSVGVALSGPVALVAAGQWRLAWAAFAAVGLAVLVWNLLVMPAGNPDSTREPLEGAGGQELAEPAMKPEGLSEITFGWLVGRRSLPLFGSSVGIGIASAAYWTFSRDLVVQAGGLGQAGSTTFWVVLGVSGLLGGAAGDLVGHLRPRCGVAWCSARDGRCDRYASRSTGRTLCRLPECCVLWCRLHHAHRDTVSVGRKDLPGSPIGRVGSSFPASCRWADTRLILRRDLRRGERATNYFCRLRRSGSAQRNLRSA